MNQECQHYQQSTERIKVHMNELEEYYERIIRTKNYEFASLTKRFEGML